MIASDDPINHHDLKIIVLFGINYEFSIHYKFDDVHTLVPNKIFIMNYDEQKNRKIRYENASIMSNDQFLILNKNLPIHRKITRLIRYCNKYYSNIISDHVNTMVYKSQLNVLKQPCNNNGLDYVHINIKKIPYSESNNHSSIWIDLQRLVDHKFNWSDLKSKIIYHGLMATNENKSYYLENLYSDCNIEMIYIDSDYLPLLLNQFYADPISQTTDPIITPSNPIQNKHSVQEKSKEEIQILKHKLSIETKRVHDYQNAYLEIIELFNKISRKKIEPVLF
jgi:hypothetical protein